MEVWRYVHGCRCVRGCLLCCFFFLSLWSKLSFRSGKVDEEEGRDEGLKREGGENENRFPSGSCYININMTYVLETHESFFFF